MTALFKRIRRLLVAACVLPVAACSRTPNPIPVGTDTVYYGNIASGEKFGVKIGDSRTAARVALEAKNGFAYYAEDNCGYKVRTLTACASDFRADLYDVDRFLQRGLVVLAYDEERIIGIVWDFQALPASDF